MNKRIWELDALRGLAVLLMVVLHILYDLTELFSLVEINHPAYAFIMDWAGVPFLVISGICATFGGRTVKRGITVFLWGMVCTGVTFTMEQLGLADSGFTIWFGVLHCLGVCMLLWPLLQRLHPAVLGCIGIALIVIGFAIKTVFVPFPWLTPVGLTQRHFASSDFFPLMPNFGYFLLGAVVGKTLYRNKQSLFPKVKENFPILVFLRQTGAHSLPIYLAHQPVIYAILWLITSF